MILVYKPAGADEERFDIDTLSAVEAGAVERVLEEHWGRVEELLREGAPTAMLGVLWAFRKRSEPTLRFANVDVPNWRKTLYVRLSLEEVADMVSLVDKTYPDDCEERTDALDQIRAFAADESDVDLALTESAPKESGTTSGASTTSG